MCVTFICACSHGGMIRPASPVTQQFVKHIARLTENKHGRILRSADFNRPSML